MPQPKLFNRIRDELKRTVRLLLEQLRRKHPTDNVYAILLEVDVNGIEVIRIAGSEESLTRLAEKYVTKGYQAKSGDVLKHLRAFLRWDAPGDNKDGWYWGHEADEAELTRLIHQAVKSKFIKEYDPDDPLRQLCVDALRELDQEGVFGTGRER